VYRRIISQTSTESHAFKPSEPLSKLAKLEKKRGKDARIVREMASKYSDYDQLQGYVLRDSKILVYGILQWTS
jgi:hypothetical protein